MTKTVSGTTTIEAQYGYDPYGIATKLQGSQEADFQYAGYYMHARSGLNMPVFRAYSSSLGRFINRDPIGEDGGINLFGYVGGSPTRGRDTLGLKFFVSDPNIKKLLNELHAEIGPIIDVMEASETAVYILYVPGKSETISIGNPVNGNQLTDITFNEADLEGTGGIGRGSGSAISFDLNTTNPRGSCTARASLAHEIGHAFMLMFGIQDKQPSKSRKMEQRLHLSDFL